MLDHLKDSFEQRRTVLEQRRRRGARRRPRLRRRRRIEYLRTSNLFVFVPSFRTTERSIMDICCVCVVSSVPIIDTAYAPKILCQFSISFCNIIIYRENIFLFYFFFRLFCIFLLSYK